MKDIDFDELDRAVSSVLGQQSPKDDNAGDVAQAVATEDPAPTTTEAEAPTETPAETEQAQTPPAGATPLAIKRRGKFMDVMHPSADMTSATPAAPVKPVRTSPVLQPISTDVKPETPIQESPEPSASPDIVEPTAELDESHALIGAEPAPVENLLPEHVAKQGEEKTEVSDDTDGLSGKEAPSTEEVASVAVTEEQAPQESTESVKSLYVDPLELADAKEVPAEEAEESVDTDVQSPSETATEPTGTPFLTDAQVDKRPLGAFGDAENAPDTSAPVTPEQPAAPVDRQAAPAVPLPRELQPDVVEVESASAQEAEVSPVPLASGSKPDGTDDGRVEGHPLFDTSTYHEPIAAAHGKGMPGWMKWLIGLLLCLALGAGVGYFLFTAGL